MRFAIALFLSAMLGGAHACSLPTERSGWSKSRLVDGTATVVLAKFTRAEPQPTRFKYHFRPLKVLKGKLPAGALVLELEPAPRHYTEVTFQDHEAAEFWDGTYGRLPWLNGSCTPRYAFEVAGSYLLFIESLDNGASAERIKSTNDRWYKYVEQRAARKP